MLRAILNSEVRTTSSHDIDRIMPSLPVEIFCCLLHTIICCTDAGPADQAIIGPDETWPADSLRTRRCPSLHTEHSHTAGILKGLCSDVLYESKDVQAQYSHACAGVLQLVIVLPGLWIFGRYLEAVLYTPALSLTAIYLLPGIAGCLASANLAPFYISVGPAGSVAALLGEPELSVVK